MHADGVDVFDKANGDFIVVGITDNFRYSAHVLALPLRIISSSIQGRSSCTRE